MAVDTMAVAGTAVMADMVVDTAVMAVMEDTDADTVVATAVMEATDECTAVTADTMVNQNVSGSISQPCLTNLHICPDQFS